MKKIKVLLIGMSSNLGGIETYIYNLVKHSDSQKIQFDHLSSGTDKIVYEDELQQMGVKIYKITPRNVDYKKHINEFKKVILENDYDYIHYSVMSFSWCEPIILANKYSKAKIIVHSHNAGFDKKISIRTKILHALGKFRTRKIPYLRVACGKGAGEFMFDGQAYTIFNNGVNLEKFQYNIQNRKEIRKELNISEDKIVIGLTARLERQKNTLFLLDIFYELSKLNTRYILMLTGDGSLRNDILGKAKEYGIADKVLLLGQRNDAYKIYSAYDIFLMPSLYEGLSISAIEAQVNGLKCYTSSMVDLKSNITGNVEFLALEKSAGEWAKYINESDNSRDEKVLEKVPDEFNAKKSYKKVLDFYNTNLT